MAVYHGIQDTYEPALVCTSCFHSADTALYTIGCRRPDIHQPHYYCWAIIQRGVLMLLLESVHYSGPIHYFPERYGLMHGHSAIDFQFMLNRERILHLPVS